ncbi:MAG: four helix bundle protein [Pyrinomonadaceae bacterium]|nr:four helix bundle protein [Pyrinomonadaceae bacterium]
MNEVEFKRRTKDIAQRVIKVVQALPRNYVAETIGRQLLRSGTSIGANYRQPAAQNRQPTLLTS